MLKNNEESIYDWWFTFSLLFSFWWFTDIELEMILEVFNATPYPEKDMLIVYHFWEMSIHSLLKKLLVKETPPYHLVTCPTIWQEDPSSLDPLVLILASGENQNLFTVSLICSSLDSWGSLWYLPLSLLKVKYAQIV